jgi:hypothetical protein
MFACPDILFLCATITLKIDLEFVGRLNRLGRLFVFGTWDVAILGFVHRLQKIEAVPLVAFLTVRC